MYICFLCELLKKKELIPSKRKIKTVFLYDDLELITMYKREKPEGTYVKIANNVLALEKEFQKKFNKAFFINVDYIHLYIVLHGTYNEQGAFAVQYRNGLLRWDVLQKFIIKYLGHIPMFVIGTCCYAMSIHNIIFKLLPSSRVVTLGGWFGFTHINKHLYTFSQHPLVFIQMLTLLNPPNIVYDSIFVISYKIKSQLVRFESFRPTEDKESEKSVVKRFILLQNHPFMIRKDYFHKVDVISKQSVNILRKISTMDSLQEQSYLFAGLEKDVQSFMKKHLKCLRYFANEGYDLVERIVHRPESVIQFKQLKHDFQGYADIHSLLDTFKRVFRKNLGNFHYTYAHRNLQKYAEAFHKTWIEVLKNKQRYYDYLENISYDYFLMFNITSLYDLIGHLKKDDRIGTFKRTWIKLNRILLNLNKLKLCLTKITCKKPKLKH